VLHGCSWVTLPAAIQLILVWIKGRILHCHLRALRPVCRDVSDVFRVDAKAEGDVVAIGGWESFMGVPASQARWFAFQLTRVSAPWVFFKGEPFKLIGSLELLAVLVALMVFGPGSDWAGCKGTVVIPGLTDNRANQFVIDKFMTTKFPMSIFLMEMAVQLDSINAVLHLQWVPREQNVEADALTNACFSDFDCSKRVHIDSLESLPWLVAPGLFDHAMSLDSEITAQKEKRKQASFCSGPQPASKKRMSESLRYTQPWWISLLPSGGDSWALASLCLSGFSELVLLFFSEGLLSGRWVPQFFGPLGGSSACQVSGISFGGGSFGSLIFGAARYEVVRSCLAVAHPFGS
jgi:hypothetical protein